VGAGILRYLFSEYHLGSINFPNLRSFWVKFGKKELKTSIILYLGQMNLKYIGMQLCTWIEIMTCIGITLSLLYLQNYNLAILTLIVFTPLIGFHFAVTKLSRMEDCGTRMCLRKFAYSE
jgi:hypothetical protein